MQGKNWVESKGLDGRYLYGILCKTITMKEIVFNAEDANGLQHIILQH